MARRKRSGYLYTFISLTLIQFLFGIFAVFLIAGQALTNQLKEQVRLIVEIKPGTTENEIHELRGWLARKEFVLAESISFTDKEQALQMLRDDLGSESREAMDALGLINPLYDILTFSVQADYVQDEFMQQLQLEIREHESVYDVYFQQSLVEVISLNIQRIGIIGIGLALLVLMLTISMITSTVRLSMYANRFLIKNMQMVGAPWSFIRRPYMRKAMAQSLMSSVFALALIVLVLYWINENVGFVFDFLPLHFLAAGALAIVLTGLLITLLATRLSVQKYLRLKLDDLY